MFDYSDDMRLIEWSKFEVFVSLIEREEELLIADCFDPFDLGLVILDDEDEILWIVSGLNLDEGEISTMDERLHRVTLGLSDEVVLYITTIDILRRYGNPFARILILEDSPTGMPALCESKKRDMELISLLVVLEDTIYPRGCSSQISCLFELLDLILDLLRMVDTDTLTDIHERIIHILFAELEEGENLFLCRVKMFHKNKEKRYNTQSIISKFFLIANLFSLFYKIAYL